VKSFYTYVHAKPNGDIFYVGKGFGKRSHSHSGRNRHHRNVTAKYGWKGIQIFVFPCASEEQAFADEIQQIAQLRRDGYELVNYSSGGEGPSGVKRGPQSPEIVAKRAAANRGKTRSIEVRTLLSLQKMGNTHGKGKVRSAEARKKSSLSQLGNKHGVGNRSHLGRTASAETRAKMSAAHTGMSMSHKGKPWSEARRAAYIQRHQSI